MGDVLTLIEKAEEAFDEQEAIRLQKKLMENQFTLQDFLEQLQRIRKMGSFASLLGMIPGMNRLRDQIDEQEMEKRLKKVEAIINSMTKGERANPKIINASRRKRIAAGSGVEVRDVNEVLKQFADMQELMKKVRKGRFPGLPGAGQMPMLPGAKPGGSKPRGRFSR